jgi:SAM-dependent methyltransferase
MKYLITSPAIRLLICGAAALFWELALIRWMGASIRVVAYYSNFVLISAFFGLGAGALTVRYNVRLWKFIFGVLALCVLGSPLLGSVFHLNPASPDEFVWIGAPQGILPQTVGPGLATFRGLFVPYWVILTTVYVANSFLFLIFGQWLGHLFQRLPPLKAYTVEIAGSVLGVFMFALISYLRLSPGLWFLIGFILILLILDPAVHSYPRAILFSLIVVAGAHSFAGHFTWSPYYKIYIAPFDKIVDSEGRSVFRADRPVGHALTVNNDYHQMIVDLTARSEEHAFFKSWRWLYDYPYRNGDDGRQGPVLIVGAGTGNDVSAALRNTTARIDAVEIDPVIVELGRRYHFEQPYKDPRVKVTVDDARSFFARTDRRYGKVVFGFLDSHTLMSSFSSVRLDNFVYTYESLQRVKDILLPGGKVYLTFATNEPWLHERLIRLMDAVFDYSTEVAVEKSHRFANGIVYGNGKAAETTKATARPDLSTRIPTDDWPFLYMRDAVLPNHYKTFMIMVVVIGSAALLLLPAGERKLKLPYFFMGAGFFLLETNNVVSLSLLYGSTWTVNVTVFSGILILILLGNLTCMATSRPRYGLIFTLLFANLAAAYALSPSDFLKLDSTLLRGLLAVPVFLGPVYFASLVFGHLIKHEANFYQAYGSNLLGAVIGGSFEYFSLVMGIKFLLIITFVFYGLAFLFLRTGSGRTATA